MFIKLIISFIFATSLNLFSDDHSEEQSFPGMVSSDVFDMGGGMEMHVERRKIQNLVIREQFLNTFIRQV